MLIDEIAITDKPFTPAKVTTRKATTEEATVKRVEPMEMLRGLPCSVVAVSSALKVETWIGFPATNFSVRYGHITLGDMNKFVRINLAVKKQTNYQYGGRPKLKELPPCKAIVYVKKHYLYMDGNVYYSFFGNDNDDVVCIWELTDED